MHKTVLQYLYDILEAIGNIEGALPGSHLMNLLRTKRRKDAVIRNFEVIGGAIKNFPSELKERYLKTDWKKIAGFREVLTHAYFGVKPTIL